MKRLLMWLHIHNGSLQQVFGIVWLQVCLPVDEILHSLEDSNQGSREAIFFWIMKIFGQPLLSYGRKENSVGWSSAWTPHLKHKVDQEFQVCGLQTIFLGTISWLIFSSSLNISLTLSIPLIYPQRANKWFQQVSRDCSSSSQGKKRKLNLSITTYSSTAT